MSECVACQSVLHVRVCCVSECVVLSVLYVNVLYVRVCCTSECVTCKSVLYVRVCCM